MPTRVRPPLLLAVVGLAACATTRTGSLQAVGDGHLVAATVELRSDRLFIRSSHPETGEALTGVLDEIAQQPRGPSGPPEVSRPGGAPPFGPAGAPGPGLAASTGYEGELHGAAGMELRCRVTLERGLRVRGEGVCRPATGGPPATLLRLRF